jgi:glycosyltransferase involved in cell wall biosynthesis
VGQGIRDHVVRAVTASVRHARRRAELRRRRVPRFAPSTGGRARGGPTVYYVAPDSDKPRGGIRVIYRHVDTLNALSIPASVVHARPGFRCTWFEHDTRVTHGAAVTLGPADVLVVPEWYGPGLSALPAGVRTVVFNQRAYDTFDLVPYATSAPGAPYAGLPGLVAILAVSQDNVDVLDYAFPGVPVHLVRNVVDAEVFFRPPGPRARRIAYLTHRRPAEREQLFHILRSRGVAAGWDLVPIEARTERQTAALLRQCAIFLSFSEREGFGLPPAEAMAAGCYVVGFTGLAGRDFFDPSYCSPVPEADLLAFARAVEAACDTHERDPATLAEAGRRASQAILARYRPDHLRDDLRAVFGSLTGSDAENAQLARQPQ